MCSNRPSVARRLPHRTSGFGMFFGTGNGFILFVFLVVVVGSVCGQFRNEQDPEYYRYQEENIRGRRPYTTPPPSLGSYRSGDTYHGTNRRYGGGYDLGNQPRGFDGRYETENRYTDLLRYGGDRYLTQGMYDSRGRLRPGYDDRNRNNLDEDKLDAQIGVLQQYRPDLQGELRPGKIPGVNLPLAENLFVTTDSGKVQGFYVYLYDQPNTRFDKRPVNLRLDLQSPVLNVSCFLGIPYAQPPVVEGRFKPPRRVQNWYTTWQALDFRPACPQNLKYVGTSNGIRNGVHEDCLYLNIYTPTVSINIRDPYPVMFYIHGGDFDHGASNQFPGHMLSAWGEVVVVTINYRLGALGFLSTADENSPGNYGLLDMSMALEWVYNNIRFFNGDREKITVFGPGAGGAAAGLLAVLPKTRSFVRQFISSSGSPLADWAAIDDIYRVQNTSRVYGMEVGCSVESSYKLLQCLNRRNYEELASAPITPDVGTFAWSPVVDRNMSVPLDDWYEDWKEEDWRAMPENPIKMIRANLHHPELKVMAGVNKDEAANMVYEDSLLNRDNHAVSEKFFDLKIKEWVKRYNYSLNPEGAFDAIKWMYTFWPDPKNETHIRDEYVNMLSDALYKSGIDQLVKETVNSTQKRSVPTYYYLLNTTLDALKLPYWREVPGNLEYYFLSGAPFMDPDFYPENYRLSRQQFSEGDRNISQFMMKTFANFAKWGNPTQVQVPVMKVKWEPVLEGTLRYLSINNTFNTTMRYNYRQTQNSFWYHYMPLVVREWIPTPRPPRNPWTDMTEPVTAAMYSFIAITIALMVVLCVCLGLWKSANRQRNKALDDLQYYSCENLADERSNYDEGVRKYLERMPSSNKSNADTMEMTRSTTPATLMTTADTTHDQSRPDTPNGILNASASNGRIAQLSEADGRSLKSNKGGSPYSVRKAYSERPHTPGSTAQYSDGVYIGPKVDTGLDTLERSPSMTRKPRSNLSQPAINNNGGSTYGTLRSNYNEALSAPNVAYLSNKSSSDVSTNSQQLLQPNSQQILIGGQPHQVIYQPIHTPIIQNPQQVMYQPQQDLGIPLLPQTNGVQQPIYQRLPSVAGQPQASPSETGSQLGTQPYTYHPQQHPQHQYPQHQYPQQQHPQQQLPQQQHMPQPMPRSNLPQDPVNLNPQSVPDQPVANVPNTISRSRPMTPSSLTLEISMKNSGKSLQTAPGGVINTEL